MASEIKAYQISFNLSGTLTENMERLPDKYPERSIVNKNMLFFNDEFKTKPFSDS